MNSLLSILNIVGIFESVLFIGGLLYAVYLWASGVFPALLRLGNGLAKRKIALFSRGDNMDSLKTLLMDSKLFKVRNIIEISKKQDIGRAESATVFLVSWPEWANEMDDILRKKRDQCPLVVYAPADKGRIPDAEMVKLDGHRHTAVTNFRGRLINDIVVSMITTSSENE